jgi:hypothetical protein
VSLSPLELVSVHPWRRVGTLAGIFAKLEWGERDPEVTEAVIADLQRWLRARL